MLKSVKKEEFGFAVEGDLVVGSNTNCFALEEMKKAADRNFKFSTNKIKTEMELENLMTRREGLKLEENSSNSVLEGLQEGKIKEGLQDRIIKRGLQARKLLKDELLESAIPYEGLVEHDSMREGVEEGKMLNEGLEENKILSEGLDVTSSEAKVDDNQKVQSSLEAVRKEKSEIK